MKKKAEVTKTWDGKGFVFYTRGLTIDFYSWEWYLGASKRLFLFDKDEGLISTIDLNEYKIEWKCWE